MCWARGYELGRWLHATQGQASGPHVQSGGEGLLPSCTFWVLIVKASLVGHGACTGGWAQALGCLQSHQREVGGRRAGMVCPGLLSKRKWNHTGSVSPQGTPARLQVCAQGSWGCFLAGTTKLSAKCELSVSRAGLRPG